VLRVYVDTSAWIALQEPRDRNHRKARAALLDLMDRETLLVSGWHTVVVFADGLARHYDQRTASTVVGKLLASPSLRVEPSEPHREAALEMLRDRGDWNVDLSDCLSFALMQATAITQAFTYDRDFAKARFGTIG